MSDEEETRSRPRSRQRSSTGARQSTPDDEAGTASGQGANVTDNGASPRRSRARSTNGGRTNAATAAGRAAHAVAELTGHEVETVISIEPCDDGWKIGVEVVETRRIPDSADILASYEVRVDSDAQLVSYRRTHRYARGQLYGGSR